MGLTGRARQPSLHAKNRNTYVLSTQPASPLTTSIGATAQLCRFVVQDLFGFEHPLNFALPITQTDLADALGISAVHVNRVVQWFRRRKLIAFGDNRCPLDLQA